ncbi:hypothetical protein [Bifidobacterium parmae]|uniref:hypothetical protein n=1 Tax=Bifidobacterium parmae TaxID=361854 RepID=UPI0010558D78|nr:hypothetical protein [Bifidobacterium parmae]
MNTTARFVGRLFPLIGTICLFVALAGCSVNAAGGHDTGTNTKTTDGYDLNTSYSTELGIVQSQLRSDSNDNRLGLSILEDGVVTEGELNELKEQYDQCFIDHGYDPGSFDFDKTGAGSVYPPSGLSEEERKAWGERTNTVQQTCDQRNGTAAIRGLVASVQMNPDNKDIRKTIVTCLIEQGLVDGGYTVNDYDTDLADQSGPFSAEKNNDTSYQSKLRQCQS